MCRPDEDDTHVTCMPIQFVYAQSRVPDPGGSLPEQLNPVIRARKPHSEEDILPMRSPLHVDQACGPALPRSRAVGA
jgi:hypothetical protein